MAVCIISIYKIARRLGGYLSLSALVMCGVSALIINFLAIRVNPFLTKTYYYILGTMILFAATGTTCYNRYLYRHNKPLGEGAPHAGTASAEESDELLASAAGTAPAGELMPDSDSIEPEATEPLPEPETAPKAADEDAVVPEPDTSIEPEAASTMPAPAKEDALDDAVLDQQAAVPETNTDAAASENENDLEAKDLPNIEAEPDASLGEPAIETQELPNVEAKADDSEAKPAAETQASPDAEPANGDSEAEHDDKTQELPDVEAKAGDFEAEHDKETPALPDSEAESTAAKTEHAAGTQPLPESKSDFAGSMEEDAVEPEPESESKPTDEPKPDTLALPDGLDSMDALLDFAFAQTGAEAYDMALLAYSTALKQYHNDAYAPFIVIDMVNLYKSQGRYREAIACVHDAMDIPAIQESPAYQQNFQNYLAQLESIYHNADTPHHSSKD